MVKGHWKYLGLPSSLSWNKKDIFEPIYERIVATVAVWKERQISMGGKEILIKKVAQTIPNYTMRLFRLLVGIYDWIRSIYADF